MYITIDDIKGEKRIDLSYPIYSKKEIAVVSIDVLRTSKLVNGTKITISLNELDNSDNLEDGRPSKTLFTYYVTDSEYFMHFKPATLQYKKLKNETITYLTQTLKITDQNNGIITYGLETTVVLHIRDRKM